MTEITMREACKHCRYSLGYIEAKGGQDCVYCFQCRRYQYCAPKVETGREARSMTTVHNGIKPKQRARVLLRSNGRCELCGAAGEGVYLHVGHLLSVKAGMETGDLTEAELNDDENLAAMCEECNAGIGGDAVPLRFAVRLLLGRLRGGK